MASQQPASFLEELLPGIPNDVTLSPLIVGKLPWSAFYVLSSVSLNWQRAIQSREVYRERVRTHSTERLVVVKHHAENDTTFLKHEFSLYSMRERMFYQLPPLPLLPANSRLSDLVSCDGKLFAVLTDSRCKCIDCSEKLLPEYSACIGNQSIPAYVFDVAGQQQWKACKNIQDPQHKGSRGFKSGDEEFAYYSVEQELQEESERDRETIYTGWVYTLGDIAASLVIPEFMVEGKFYHMIPGPNHQIEVYDTETKSWALQHSGSCEGFASEMISEFRQWRRGDPLFTIKYLVIVPLDNELLALAQWNLNARFISISGYSLLASTGFGTQRREIEWQEFLHPFTFSDSCSFAMCPIEL